MEAKTNRSKEVTQMQLGEGNSKRHLLEEFLIGDIHKQWDFLETSRSIVRVLKVGTYFTKECDWSNKEEEEPELHNRYRNTNRFPKQDYVCIKEGELDGKYNENS